MMTVKHPRPATAAQAQAQACTHLGLVAVDLSAVRSVLRYRNVRSEAADQAVADGERRLEEAAELVRLMAARLGALERRNRRLAAALREERGEVLEPVVGLTEAGRAALALHLA